MRETILFSIILYSYCNKTIESGGNTIKYRRVEKGRRERGQREIWTMVGNMSANLQPHTLFRIGEKACYRSALGF